jgi:hypothetical protein
MKLSDGPQLRLEAIAMSDHAIVQGRDCTRAGRRKNERQYAVDDACQSAGEHANAKAECRTQMLPIGLADR